MYSEGQDSVPSCNSQNPLGVVLGFGDVYIYIYIDSVLGFRVGGFTVCDLSLELYTGFCVLGLRIQL